MPKSDSKTDTTQKIRTLPLLALATVIVGLAATSAKARVRYIAIDLGAVPGFNQAHAHSINNEGQIVGEVLNPGPPYTSRAVLFDASGDGNNIDLGTIGGFLSTAEAINDDGQIVGGALNAQQDDCAVLFDPTGDGNNITLDANGHVFSINEEGQIVGARYYIEDGNVVNQAAIFNFEGEGNTVDLGKLPGYRESVAFCINNRRQIVGASVNGWYEWDADYRATLFDPNELNNIDLGTLGGAISAAFSINDSNQIVGFAEDANGYMFATLFDPTGEGNNVNLGTISGYDIKSYAQSINNKGQIVGRCETGGSSPVAVLFDATGAGNNINLNNLINPALEFTLFRANCINDNGWIVGKFTRPGKGMLAFLLKPAREGDIEPDGDVDFEDFAVFASAWKSRDGDINWNVFCDISSPEDGVVDELDLSVFCSNWLAQQ